MFSLRRCSRSTPSRFPLFLFLTLLASQFLYNFIFYVALLVRQASPSVPFLVFDSTSFNAPLNFFPPNTCLQGSSRWFCYIGMPIAPSWHCLCSPFHIFSNLICLKWRCIGAMLLPTLLFLHQIFKYIFKIRFSLRSCVANHLLHIP